MLDTDQLKHLSDGDKELASFLEKFFESKEWKYLADLLEQSIEVSKNEILHATTWEANRVAFGRLSAYLGIASLPEALRNELAIRAEASAESSDELSINESFRYE